MKIPSWAEEYAEQYEADEIAVIASLPAGLQEKFWLCCSVASLGWCAWPGVEATAAEAAAFVG